MKLEDGIQHRDVNVENCVIIDGEAKIFISRLSARYQNSEIPLGAKQNMFNMFLTNLTFREHRRTGRP